MGEEIRGSAGSRRAMLRADGPAEGDDSKETNTAVALPTTDRMVDEKTPVGNDWNLEGKLKMQRNKGISDPHMLTKTLNPQTLCPDENRELGTKK